MHSYHFYQWLSFFYFYCLFGWCFESTFVSICSKHFVNRGFMKGPWLPLYGTGAISVLFITLPFQDNPILVYFIGALTATILEYIAGTLMVTFFKVRYWDYSHRKIQLHGHICLFSSIAWGFLSLLMVYFVHTPVSHFILSLNDTFVLAITSAMTIFMLLDFINSFRHAMDLRRLIIQAERLKKNLARRIELQKQLVKASAEEQIMLIKAYTDFGIEFYSDQLKEKVTELQNALSEQKYDPTEMIVQFEAMVDREIVEMRKRKEKILKKIQIPATYAMKHNPGFKVPSLKKDFSKYKQIFKKTDKKD